jgi:catechol 2,3-dioxygenase
MLLPETNPSPPFRISRASHGVFTAKDLDRTREFYEEVVGLVTSHQDKDALYLRGLEERCHHSLVFRRSDGPAACERLGMRVHSEEDLDRAQAYFESRGCPTKWVEVHYQGRTLHTADIVGTPLELCSSMDVMPRCDMEVNTHKGAASRRFDHYQILVPDVRKGAEFYTAMGFRIADCLTVGDHIVGAFLTPKNTPYDIVFLERDGPAFHHFGYIIPDLQALFRACDTAGLMGYGDNVEYGPGKHALGHSYYVYVLDPDRHRFELLLPPIVYMDTEDAPAVYDVTQHPRSTETWGLPPRTTWFSNTSPFRGATVTSPPVGGQPRTLEAYLEMA